VLMLEIQVDRGRNLGRRSEGVEIFKGKRGKAQHLAKRRKGELKQSKGDE